ncbi:GntR family transcriptional regulator [Streptomyces sp. NPDC004539]|uniref:GntR family transcriptional regulator n=1 Tax=Streptomyces sp. NPDC004539 TaxID=3154280 RepID=UPI0033BF8450
MADREPDSGNRRPDAVTTPPAHHPGELPHTASRQLADTGRREEENAVNTIGHSSAAPQWQKHLEGVHTPAKGARLTGTRGERFRTAVRAAYADGATLRGISDHLGCSFGRIRKIVRDAGSLRPRGGSNPRIPDSLTAQEWAAKILRSLITDGTCKPYHLIPTLSRLSRETGISRGTFRKAAQKAQADGLLLMVPGRGIVALDPENPLTGDTLRVCVQPGRWETWLTAELEIPDFEYLRKALITKIADGSWRAGGSIPTQATIQRRFGVTRHAVRLALSSLEDSGHLIRRRSRLYVQRPARRNP